jgi:hypothetical protein
MAKKRTHAQLENDRKQIFDYVACESERGDAISSFAIHGMFDNAPGFTPRLVDSTIASMIQKSQLLVVSVDEGGRDYREAKRKGARPRQLYVANFDNRHTPGKTLFDHQRNVRFARKHNMAMVPGANGKMKFIKIK